MTGFRFIKWTAPLPSNFTRRLDWWIRLWMYHRLANAGRLQIGRLVLMWPMPWADAVRSMPGYGRERPSGVRAALGIPQRGDSRHE